MQQATLRAFLQIITDNQLPDTQMEELFSQCLQIYTDPEAYANLFFENNFGGNGDEDNMKEHLFNIYGGPTSFLIYELTFNDFDYVATAWGEDTVMIHDGMLALLNDERYPAYPDGENFNLDAYMEFIRNEMKDKSPDYVLYEFLGLLPSEDESAVFFKIRKEHIPDFERIRSEIGLKAINIFE